MAHNTHSTQPALRGHTALPPGQKTNPRRRADLTPPKLSTERNVPAPKRRVARRPEEASRERTPAAAVCIERLFLPILPFAGIDEDPVTGSALGLTQPTTTKYAENTGGGKTNTSASRYGPFFSCTVCRYRRGPCPWLGARVNPRLTYRNTTRERRGE